MNSDKTYDLIVIGAGPAGITSAIYAIRKEMDCLVLTGDIGGQTVWSSDVENYTGFQVITGPELAGKFEDHVAKYGITVNQNEPVLNMEKRGDLFWMRTAKAEYRAKTVIIASGKVSKELGVPGEKEFKNRGVTYCATCDGPLFKGKDVAVIGGGNSALDAAIQLIKIAEKVYIINITSELGGDAIMRSKVEKGDNVTVMNGSEVVAITGDKFVSGIKVRTDGRETDIPVEGVFVEIGLLPNSSFAAGVDRNERQEIKVNCHNETSLPGVFAAGDVTDVPEKQIIIAAGEGAKAALSAFKYLAQQKG